MTVAPGSLFSLLLLLGALFVAVLLVLALIPAHPPVRESAVPRDPPSWRWLFGGALLAQAVVSGPVALVLVLLLWIARRWGPRVMPAFAFLAFVAAGVFSAWSPATLTRPLRDVGAFGLPAQVASVVAVASVLTGLIAGAKGFKRSGGGATRRIFAPRRPRKPSEEEGPSSLPVELLDNPEPL
jgi:MFS family permease